MSKRAAKPYQRPERLRLRAVVVHGDLRYARHPIVVGHYEGDTIVGAEAYVDRLLGGALYQRYALGLYPGEFGSLAMVLRKATPVQAALSLPSAAIVMGLGKWGDLTAGQLADLLRRAALQYVLALTDRRDASPESRGTTISPVGLSVLLIGGNSATNIDIGDSVGAILRGLVHANRELADDHITDLRIEEVEIIELYADRAIAAAHACKRLAKYVGKEFDTDIDAAPLLLRGRDGRSRLSSGMNRNAWRRWEVSVVNSAGESTGEQGPSSGDAKQPEVYREIRFLTLSDRARAEAISQQRQPELMERLIKDSITQTDFRPEESRVLFELTVPNDLKASLAQIDNLVLVVDAESATFPWELMSPGDKPLCISKSLVRQLQTTHFRPQSARAGKAAYVVGDPRVTPPTKQLQGARDEALKVYGLLKSRFEVNAPEERPSALDVLSGLYERPYRIVHLAGHGQYEPPSSKGGRARSGLVLDNGVFLTAVEIGQMQQVPELVFLNCCHTGQTGPDAGLQADGVEYNRLAASISRELIEMGVRAVVAAGWAVDDAAAPKFAEEFYSAMLAGEPFGKALTAARRRIYDLFGSSNTWGAYQAYGDPDYRLDPEDIQSSSPSRDHVDVAELIEAIRKVDRRAADAANDGEALSRAADEIDDLVANSPEEWLMQTDVLMELGYAFGDLNHFDTAVDYLRKALEVESTNSTLTLRAVERLANYEARLADVASADFDRAELMRRTAIARLKNLIAVHESAERYLLLGSAYKRVAAAETDPAKARTALSEASHAYRQAHQRNQQRQIFDTYPVLNWLTLAFILDEQVPDGEELLDRCDAVVAERFAQDRSFFSAMGLVESRLVRSLRAGRLGEPDEGADAELAAVESRMRQVIADTAPNGRELNSVYTQIDSTCELLEKLQGERAATAVTINRLRHVRESVSGSVSG